MKSFAEQLVDRYAARLGGGINRETTLRIIRGTVLHEAGHAVARAVLYEPEAIEFVTIEPDEERDLHGFCRNRPFSHLSPRINLDRPIAPGLGDTRTLALWKRRALIAIGTCCYAGVAAQYPDADLDHLDVPWLDLNEPIEEPVGDEVFDPIWQNSEGDRHNLARFAQELGTTRPVDRWHRPSWKRAQRLVHAHWPEVETIAAELFQRGRVKGRRIRSVVASAGLE